MKWRITLFGAGVVVTVWAALHASSVGASWSTAWHLIANLGWAWLIGLGVLWFVGLCAHTVVLTASMPGLSHLRALTLNLSGSAVANVLPLGGVVGTVFNMEMVRGWGHSGLDFTRFVVVSKAWDLVAKLFMPVVAIAGLLVWGLMPGRHTAPWLLATAGGAVAGCLVVAALTGRAGPLLRLVSLAERGWIRLRQGRWSIGDGSPGWHAAVTRLLDGADRLVRRRWAELSWGMAAYWLLQGALLWLCMVAVGMHVAPPVIFAGLVAERLLTLVAVTPGGAGVVEAGAIGVLIALDVAPTGALAGILLYRAFVFLAEIPVGGLATLAWLATRRAVPRPAA